MTYRTIVADPPWPITRGGGRRTVRPNQPQAMPYETLSIPEIRDLPVASLADTDAHLFLWVTHKHLPLAFGIAEGWDFRYECLLTWRKPSGMTPFSFMYSTEHALFCRRGNLPLARLGRRLDIVATCERQHSRKPDAFLDLVEDVSPGPYLEMFARRARFGWDYWGDESLQTVEIDR